MRSDTTGKCVGKPILSEPPAPDTSSGSGNDGGDGGCGGSGGGGDGSGDSSTSGLLSIGNPIQGATGSKTQFVSLYSSGGTPRLILGLVYSSRQSNVDHQPNYGFGINWISTYSHRINGASPDVPTVLSITRPNGRNIEFTQQADTVTYLPDAANRNMRLLRQKNSSGATTGWRLKVEDIGAIEVYDANGLLTSVNGSQGQVQSFTNDATWRLRTVSDVWGRSIVLGYTIENRVASITLPDTTVISLGYDSTSHLTSLSYPGIPSRQFLYEDARFPNALTGIVDESGIRYASFAYDASGKAMSTAHAGDVSKYQLAYGADTTVVVDPLGTERTYSFSTILNVSKSTGASQPGGSGCGPSASAVAYDANGNIASRTDFVGNKRCHAYDLTRNLETRRIEGLAAGDDCTAALASPPAPTPANPARVLSTLWHPDWRLPVQRAEPKKLTTWVYNGQPDPSAGGATASCAPSDALLPDGKPIAVLCKKIEQATTDATGAAGFSATTTGTPRTWTWTYTRHGQVLTADGPRTDVNDLTTYTYYDAADADIGRRGNLATVTNALGQVTQFTSYDLNGRVRSITDPNGVYTDFTYDLRGRLTGKTVGGESTTYTYDPVGQLTQVSLPDGTSLTYTYDPAHRLTAITDGVGNKIEFTLDAMGNRTKEDVLDPEGTLAQTRSRVYDALNRLYMDIGAQNQTTTYAYDANGNLTGITDPLNHTTSQGFDALNRLIQITDPGTVQTKFAYDGQDRLTQVTDPRNLVTGYTIDGLGKRTGQQSPDTGNTSQSFDDAGNLQTKTDARNQTTQYQYDALNRLSLVTLADGGKQAYIWDTGENGIGRLARITELNAAAQETGRTEYGYDALGRVVSETRTLAGRPYVTAYAYANGRLAGITYPSGRLVEYAYDSIGRVSQVSTTPVGGSSQVVVNNIAYQPFGTVKSFSYGNGQTYSRSIDQDGRIAGYTLAGQTKGIGYDDASRITSITDAAVPLDFINYRYDALDRLTGVVLAYKSFAYDYDANGNRSGKSVGATHIPYVLNPASNRIDAIDSSPPRSFGYDANGSVTDDGKHLYGYDVRGRLKQTTSVVGTTGYEVNALGERVRKSGPYGERIYHYDRSGKLIAEGTPQGVIDREYLYLHDLPVAVIVE